MGLFQRGKWVVLLGLLVVMLGAGRALEALRWGAGSVVAPGAFLPIVLKTAVEPTPLPTDTPMATATFEPTMTPAPSDTPAPTVAPTNTPVPLPTNTPEAPAGCTICSFNAYNCSDFSSQASAQACHDFCWAQVGFDVHELDSDDDGEACESLPLVFGGWVFVWP